MTTWALSPGAKNASDPVIEAKSTRKQTIAPGEVIIAGFALLALVTAELILTARISGTHYTGGDGVMAQAVVRAAFKLNRLFDVTSLGLVQGIGSQSLPLNVWANPAYWPFAISDGKWAADTSGLIALTCFAAACYAMARCFDLSVVASAVAAQLSILIFGPVLVLVGFTSVFVLTPGFAVVYAPHMMALGLLARIEAGKLASFVLFTSGLFLLLLYSLYCDPLWSMVSAIGWAVAFAVVAFSPLHAGTIFVRCAALACCGILFLAGGVLEYLYTLTQYTARVQFPSLITRPADLAYGSVLFTTVFGRYLYGACIFGWMLGFIALTGRPRVLVTAAAVSFAFLAAYVTAFLLSPANWWLPLPIYVEHCLYPLFAAGGVAGCWGALRQLGLFARHLADRADLRALLSVRPQILGAFPERPFSRAWIGAIIGLVAVALIPIAGIVVAAKRQPLYASVYVTPWPDEPEFAGYLSANIGLSVGKPFRGSATLWTNSYPDRFSMANLWRHGIPTANEYSQLVTPQALYLNGALFKKDVSTDMNQFMPWIGGEGSYPLLFKMFQALGVRYIVGYDPFDAAQQGGFRTHTFPRRQPTVPPGRWLIYEFPDPNVGNYSPTQVVTAASAPEMLTHLRDPNFDFRRDVVLSSGLESLVPARRMNLSIIRGGLHVSGESEGTSLVLLPQQFSHCLTASDRRVRIVRANLISTGVIFSGVVDTDISFGYGMFSPGCRRADLADVKRLGIALSGNAEKPAGRPDIMGTLRSAVAAIK
jgi:hypothetical protein